MVNQFIEEVGGRSTTMTIEECRRKKFDDASQRSLQDWMSLGEMRTSEEKIPKLCETKVTQPIRDLALQDNLVFPTGFIEYLYHVGNAKEKNLLIRNGLIPGRTSLKRRRQPVSFTTVILMEDG